jgi:hypothetical protein
VGANLKRTESMRRIAEEHADWRHTGDVSPQFDEKFERSSV